VIKRRALALCLIFGLVLSAGPAYAVDRLEVNGWDAMSGGTGNLGWGINVTQGPGRCDPPPSDGDTAMVLADGTEIHSDDAELVGGGGGFYHDGTSGNPNGMTGVISTTYSGDTSLTAMANGSEVAVFIRVLSFSWWSVEGRTPPHAWTDSGSSGINSPTFATGKVMYGATDGSSPRYYNSLGNLTGSGTGYTSTAMVGYQPRRTSEKIMTESILIGTMKKSTGGIWQLTGRMLTGFANGNLGMWKQIVITQLVNRNMNTAGNPVSVAITAQGLHGVTSEFNAEPAIFAVEAAANRPFELYASQLTYFRGGYSAEPAALDKAREVVASDDPFYTTSSIFDEQGDADPYEMPTSVDTSTLPGIPGDPAGPDSGGGGEEGPAGVDMPAGFGDIQDWLVDLLASASSGLSDLFAPVTMFNDVFGGE